MPLGVPSSTKIWHYGAALPQAILGKRRFPLRGGIAGLKLIGRRHEQEPLRSRRGVFHGSHEAGTDFEVPGIEDDAVAGVFKLPANPLGPLAIGASMADEEVDALRRYGWLWRFHLRDRSRRLWS